jgi:opacity protein-like surface antigen
MNKNRIATLAIAALTAVSALAATAPAQAADFSVTADKTQNLTIAGDVVTVTANNVPAGQGIYLRLCAGTLADAAKGRPADCVGMDKTVWASTDSGSLAQHASDATKPLQVPVVAQFTSGGKTIDCTQVACGIHVRRDHLGGSTDFTLDRFIPLTFGAVAVAKPTAKPVAKPEVKKVVAKKVTKKKVVKKN